MLELINRTFKPYIADRRSSYRETSQESFEFLEVSRSRRCDFIALTNAETNPYQRQIHICKLLKLN